MNNEKVTINSVISLHMLSAVTIFLNDLEFSLFPEITSFIVQVLSLSPDASAD